MGQYWTEVAVRGVVIDPLTGDPAILLQDAEASAIITVPADPGGTESIICELEGIHRDGPHSLIYRFFVRHGIRVNRLEIGRSARHELSAALCYLHDGHSYRMDVRPSDGILIAIQASSAMFVSEELINDRVRSQQGPRVRENSDLLILSTDPHRRFASR